MPVYLGLKATAAHLLDEVGFLRFSLRVLYRRINFCHGVRTTELNHCGFRYVNLTINQIQGTQISQIIIATYP